MFGSSLGSAGLDGVHSFLVVSVGLVKVDSGLDQNFGVVCDGLFEGGNGVLLFSNLLFETVDGLVTNSLVGSVFLVGGGLVLGHFGNNFV